MSLWSKLRLDVDLQVGTVKCCLHRAERSNLCARRLIESSFYDSLLENLHLPPTRNPGLCWVQNLAMDYSYYAGPQPQPFTAYGLPNPEQPTNAQSHAFAPLVSSLFLSKSLQPLVDAVVRTIMSKTFPALTPHCASTLLPPLFRPRIHPQNRTPNTLHQAATSRTISTRAPPHSMAMSSSLPIPPW